MPGGILLTAYSRCLITRVYTPTTLDAVWAPPECPAAPSPSLHSPSWLPSVGRRGAWRPARCKHLHRALKARLDAGQHLRAWARLMGFPGAPPQCVHLVPPALRGALHHPEIYLHGICISFAWTVPRVLMCRNLNHPFPTPLTPMGGDHGSYTHQTLSNRTHLLSTSCVTGLVLSPRERHYYLHFTARETEAQNEYGLVQGLEKDMGFEPRFFDTAHTIWAGLGLGADAVVTLRTHHYWWYLRLFGIGGGYS